ncbi:hypothetical protein D3C73_1008790 [compost metagenome]
MAVLCGVVGYFTDPGGEVAGQCVELDLPACQFSAAVCQRAGQVEEQVAGFLAGQVRVQRDGLIDIGRCRPGAEVAATFLPIGFDPLQRCGSQRVVTQIKTIAAGAG